MNKALVVLSGGQDSTICLFWAKQVYTEVHAITFSYGQRHHAELQAAKEVAERANVNSHEIVYIPQGTLLSTSPLLSGNELKAYDSHAQMEEVVGNQREETFVPMRNAVFLAIAANHAEALGCKHIVTGICALDTANYDDCREEFLLATNDFIKKALGYDHRKELGEPLVVVAPLLYKSKAEALKWARKYSPDCWEALAYTHTSYAGDYPPLHRNHATILREKGFEEAGLPDPLILRAVRGGLMPLPTTSNYEGIK